jgi:hypothetical protein
MMEHTETRNDQPPYARHIDINIDEQCKRCWDWDATASNTSRQISIISVDVESTPVKAGLLMTILLSITGDPGTHVRGHCIVDPSLQAVQIDTGVPYQQTFEAVGLTCSFEADGRAIIEAKRNGSSSSAIINGGRVNINIR